MIVLKELLNTIDAEKENGLINIDDWRWPDVDHLINMGFEFGDDFHLNTEKNPKITIYKKTDVDADGKKEDYFYVEEEDRKLKRFKSFNDVIDYFDTYSQPELDKNM